MGETAHDPIADPLAKWWRRIRLPLGLFFVGAALVRNWDALTSGRALPTVSALSMLAFLAWLFLRPAPYRELRGCTVQEVKALYGRETAWWALWSAVAVAISLWVAMLGDWRPAYVVYLVPLPMLAINAVMWARAEAVVARVDAQARRP